MSLVMIQLAVYILINLFNLPVEEDDHQFSKRVVQNETWMIDKRSVISKRRVTFFFLFCSVKKFTRQKLEVKNMGLESLRRNVTDLQCFFPRRLVRQLFEISCDCQNTTDHSAKYYLPRLKYLTNEENVEKDRISKQTTS